MRIPIHHVDSFTDTIFSGNPAAVCLLEEWLPTDLLQRMAMENTVANTAFVVQHGSNFEIRWFTPTAEDDLCGHATLAAAHVIFKHLDYQGNEIDFKSMSGALRVRREDDLLELDFPRRPPNPCDIPDGLIEGLGITPQEVWRSRDYLAVYDSEQTIRSLNPNFELLKTIDTWGIIVTAPGNDCDFVSRFFATVVGVPEDPVTGSSHCTLIPYWSERLKTHKLRARQVSARGGALFCELAGERIKIAGNAVAYSSGVIEL